jgi:phage gp46-like protein
MIFNRFQGDPALQITPDGADLCFMAGQPVMDQGLNNAAIISLFTRPGWWGNDLMDTESQKIGSEFEQQRTIVDVDTLNDVIDAARSSLKWMTDTGLASSVDVVVTNPRMDFINTRIRINPPGIDATELLFTKNGLSWIGQATNPATGRM